MEVYGAVELGGLITEISFEKLDFFGEEYLTEIVEIDAAKRRRENLYRTYVTSTLEFISKGAAMPMTYHEFCTKKNEKSEPKKEPTVEEIKKKQMETLNKLFRR